MQVARNMATIIKLIKQIKKRLFEQTSQEWTFSTQLGISIAGVQW